MSRLLIGAMQATSMCRCLRTKTCRGQARCRSHLAHLCCLLLTLMSWTAISCVRSPWKRVVSSVAAFPRESSSESVGAGAAAEGAGGAGADATAVDLEGSLGGISCDVSREAGPSGGCLHGKARSVMIVAS